jgi:pyruvate dehydrogenase (quinone)
VTVSERSKLTLQLRAGPMQSTGPVQPVNSEFEPFVVRALTGIYGVVGDSLNALTESLRKQDRNWWIGVRHEVKRWPRLPPGPRRTSAIRSPFAPGSCCPGNTHLINGLYDCHRSRVPVLAIATQIPSSELGCNYFQETRPDMEYSGAAIDVLHSQPAGLPDTKPRSAREHQHRA